MDSPEKIVADAWDRRRLRLKKFLMEERGMSEEDADDKATDDIRREIRNGPPIRI